jgi:hypothetical protein
VARRQGLGYRSKPDQKMDDVVLLSFLQAFTVFFALLSSYYYIVAAGI